MFLFVLGFGCLAVDMHNGIAGGLTLLGGCLMAAGAWRYMEVLESGR